MLYIFHICLLCSISSNGCELGGGGERCSVMRERETGGQAQFYWMKDGGSLKAQPIGYQLGSIKKKPLDGSEHNIYN